MIDKEEIENCLICGKALFEDGISPYSLCFDPQWKTNCWGGDTHMYKGYFCVECGDTLLRKER